MRRERLEIEGKDRKKSERVRLRMLSRLFCAGFPLARILELFHSRSFSSSFFFTVPLTACWVRNMGIQQKPLAEKMEKVENRIHANRQKLPAAKQKMGQQSRKKTTAFLLADCLDALNWPIFSRVVKNY